MCVLFLIEPVAMPSQMTFFTFSRSLRGRGRRHGDETYNSKAGLCLDYGLDARLRCSLGVKENKQKTIVVGRNRPVAAEEDDFQLNVRAEFRVEIRIGVRKHVWKYCARIRRHRHRTGVRVPPNKGGGASHRRLKFSASRPKREGVDGGYNSRTI